MTTHFKVATIKGVEDGEPKVQTFTIDSLVNRIAKPINSKCSYATYHHNKAEEKRLGNEARAAKDTGDMELSKDLKGKARNFKKANAIIKDTNAIMPFMYRNDVTFKVAKNDWKQRDNKQITHFSLLMLDIESNISAEEIDSALAGFEYVLWPTISHRPEDPRFRVVLFPSKPMPEAQAQALIHRIDAHLPDRNPADKKTQAIDPASLDVGRLMFLPMWLSNHPEQYFYTHKTGKLVSPDDFVLSPEIAAIVEARSSRSDQAKKDRQKFHLERAAVKRSDNPDVFERNGKLWLSPDAELETDAGWVTVKNITRHISNVSCPAHGDTNGSEFAGLNSLSGRPQLVCKHCGTIKMWAEREGGKVFISMNSRAQANLLAEVFKTIGKKTLLVSSETTETDEAAVAFMGDTKNESVKYDVIVCTPTVQTGVSIDNDHFTHVYGMFWNAVGTYQDIDQAMSRVRRVNTHRVWVQMVDHKAELKTEEQVYDDALATEKGTRMVLHDEATKLTRGEQLWALVYAELDKIAALANSLKVFIEA